jgi:hypothetical protein
MSPFRTLKSVSLMLSLRTKESRHLSSTSSIGPARQREYLYLVFFLRVLTAFRLEITGRTSFGHSFDGGESPDAHAIIGAWRKMATMGISPAGYKVSSYGSPSHCSIAQLAIGHGDTSPFPIPKRHTHQSQSCTQCRERHYTRQSQRKASYVSFV